MLYHLRAIDFAASFNSKKRRLDIGAAGREPHFVSPGAGANRPHIGRLSQRGLSHTDCAAPPLETQGGMMRIAITGASGFVGGHLARQLASEGHELFLLSRGVDRRDPSAIHLPRAHLSKWDFLILQRSRKLLLDAMPWRIARESTAKSAARRFKVCILKALATSSKPCVARV